MSEHLKENGLRYFFEIIVLIIGILGAFALDNWNSDRKVFDKKMKQLKSIQNEIISNINTANTVMRENFTKDLVSNMVLSDSLKFEDYVSPKLGLELRTALLSISTFTPVNDAYTSFINSSQDYSDDFNELIRKLNSVYIHQNKLIEYTNQELLSVYQSEVNHLVNNLEWYSKLMSSQQTYHKSHINYMLTDPFYKNRISKMRQMVSIMYNYTRMYKHSVLSIYHDIAIVTKEDSIADYIESQRFIPDENLKQNYIATYSSEKHPSFKIEILGKEDTLFLKLNGKLHEIFFENDSSFYITLNNYIGNFRFDKNTSKIKMMTASKEEMTFIKSSIN